MGDIIFFPSKDERGWAEVLAFLKGIVLEGGGSSQMAEWIIDDIKPRLATMDLCFSLQADAKDVGARLETLLKDLGEKIEALSKQLQSQVLLQLLGLEIELYAAKFGTERPQITFEVPKPKIPSKGDPRPASKIIALDQAASSKLDGELFPQSVDGFLNFLSGSNQLCRIEFDTDAATGAHNPVVRFKPSDALTHFVAALRALEANLLVVE